MADSPLILTGVAARRLKLLLGHGVELTPGLQERLAEAGLAEAHPASGHLETVLAAQLLQFPVVLQPHDDRDDGVHDVAASRDVQAEVAASMQTLKGLMVHAGSLVELRNTARPEVPAHLARIWVKPDATEGALYVAPTLAYNLGLPLHLSPLLHPPGQADNAASTAASPPFTGRISVARYDADSHPSSSQRQPEAGDWAHVPQPAKEMVQVPIAQEVHLSVVRLPITDLISAPSARGSDGHMPAAGGGSSVHGTQASDEALAPGGDSAPAGPRKGAQDDAVQAIQQYLLTALRFVCQGDVLAVPKHSFLAQAHILDNLHSMRWNEHAGTPQLMYVKVSAVLPAVAGAQAVDVAKTVVKLAGSCNSGVPVGAVGYLAPPTSLVGWHAAAAVGPQHPHLEYAGAMLSSWRQLAGLIAPLLHPLASRLPLRLAVLLHGPSGSGKRTAVAAAAAALGCHLVDLSCHDIRNNATSEGKVLEGLEAAFAAAARYRPTLLLLRHFDVLTEGGDSTSEAFAARAGVVLGECIQHAGADSVGSAADSPVDDWFPSPVILIASAPTAEDVAPPLRRCFTHEVKLDAPDHGGRRQLVESYVGTAGTSLSPEALDDLARHTAGLLPRDLRSLAAEACSAAALQVLRPVEAVAAAITSGSEAADFDEHAADQLPSLQEQHLTAALDHARLRTADDIGAPKIPNVRWDDVGGLEDAKRAILDTVELPLKHPELFSGGLRRRSGVLLYGPPGTGKTLLAKAVATECAVNFMSVKGPELINMYVGESERQIREVFARARRARPCVVFFDELDSLAPARGRGSDSGGVMDRVVSQLLAEIDGVQGGGGSDDVFVIGATNRPDLLDPALLRPGRLDRLLYVGVASDAESQLKVLRALTRKFALHQDVDLAVISTQCPPRLTGADMYALCSDAWMVALKACIAQQESARSARAGEDGSDAGQREVVVTRADFAAALHSLRPSLTADDIARYESIRDEYESR